MGFDDSWLALTAVDNRVVQLLLSIMTSLKSLFPMDELGMKDGRLHGGNKEKREDERKLRMRK